MLPSMALWMTGNWAVLCHALGVVSANLTREHSLSAGVTNLSCCGVRRLVTGSLGVKPQSFRF
jgi:hypothetical protein